MSLTKLVCVIGPTASGKTALSIELAKHYNGEVVSADSMQIYKYMNIGTAKPSDEEKEGIPHHMIDIVNPDENYSVAQYVADAKKVIDDIAKRGKLPILCGGTGLYVDSLIENIEFSKSDHDEKLREELRAIADEKGGEELLKMLSEFDPETAQTLHPHNIGRIIRAIEVYKTTGITMAETKRRSRLVPPRYDACKIGLDFKDREKLYERVEKRVDLMMDAGLEMEVRDLLNRGIPKDGTAMQAIGYKELVCAIEGKISYNDAVAQIKLGTRHYAKRQLTWFRRDKNVNWIYADEETGANESPLEKEFRKATDIIDNWISL